tara:strand:- start:1035 stop:1319 length:285 start_codon:yes stop_codon:yes gene_type:complete
MKLIETGLTQTQETESKLRLADATTENGTQVLESVGGKKKRTTAGHQLDAAGIASQSKLVQLDQERDVLRASVMRLQSKMQANAQAIKDELKNQ